MIDIGELSRRSGVAASALRFYEERGLLASQRSGRGRRKYTRDTLRRVAFIRAAQTLGLSLSAIREVLAGLPGERTPTAADWARQSPAWQALIDKRIANLERLKTALVSCIGCGCLSLDVCHIFNAGDRLSTEGTGARLLTDLTFIEIERL
jgi:MerR family transcriptional regulator, redox-sensitive transcriptional activator SoxR